MFSLCFHRINPGQALGLMAKIKVMPGFHGPNSDFYPQNNPQPSSLVLPACYF
jgi:hypothetical protein